jgi:putative copper export protein
MSILELIFVSILFVGIVVFGIVSGISLGSDSKKLEKASNILGFSIVILCIIFMLILKLTA